MNDQPDEDEGGAEALARALEAHAPGDGAEAADVERVIRLLRTTPRPFWRGQYEPGHITGSAFVVRLDTGQVLLHHHRRLDRWLQLGGHDDGEHDAAATALREATEESGLPDLRLLSPAILDVDVHRIPAAKGEPEHLHHDVRYVVVAPLPEALSRNVEESLDLQWHDLDAAAARSDEDGMRRALRRLAVLLTGV